jgi:hypothetical protein
MALPRTDPVRMWCAREDAVPTETAGCHLGMRCPPVAQARFTLAAPGCLPRR